jgi:maleamate amidohydrolase
VLRSSPRRPSPGSAELIVDELTPADGDVVLEKCTPSGFTSSPLDACVLGYRVGVVEDCCFDRIEASHWMSLFDLDQKYGDVIDSSAALRYLERMNLEEVGA